MEVARGHSESSLVRGNSLVRGFVFRGSTVLFSQASMHPLPICNRKALAALVSQFLVALRNVDYYFN